MLSQKLNQKRQQKKQLKTKISVITPTVRPEGVDIVRKSLRKQTFKDFEWIVITPLDFNMPDAIMLRDPPKEEGDYWTFNKAMNEAVRHSTGDLIVSVQDYTTMTPEGLQKFWYYFDNGYDRALVSGVGNKYDEDGKMVWQDPRMRTDQGTFYECFPNDVEFNYCSIPKQGFYEVGGMDEYLDKFAGMDHISLQERLDAIGYKFYLDQTNESFSTPHGRLPDWDANHAMHGPYIDRKRQLISDGIWPKLSYL